MSKEVSMTFRVEPNLRSRFSEAAGLEGFTLSKTDEQHAQRFINILTYRVYTPAVPLGAVPKLATTIYACQDSFL